MTYYGENAIRPGSSLDYIKRCAAFVELAGDFHDVLDYADEEETGEFQALLSQLEKEAMRIIAKECR